MNSVLKKIIFSSFAFFLVYNANCQEIPVNFKVTVDEQFASEVLYIKNNLKNELKFTQNLNDLCIKLENQDYEIEYNVLFDSLVELIENLGQKRSRLDESFYNDSYKILEGYILYFDSLDKNQEVSRKIRLHDDQNYGPCFVAGSFTTSLSNKGRVISQVGCNFTVKKLYNL